MIKKFFPIPRWGFCPNNIFRLMALVVMNVKFLARFKFSSLAFAALQKVSKSLDLSLSSLIASSIKEYLHQVTSEKGSQTVELEIARFAYGKKNSPKE